MVARLQKFSWIDTFEDGWRMLEVIATRVTRVEAIEAFQRWLPTIEVTGALLCFRVHTLAHPLYCGGGVVARLFASHQPIPALEFLTPLSPVASTLSTRSFHTLLMISASTACTACPLLWERSSHSMELGNPFGTQRC